MVERHISGQIKNRITLGVLAIATRTFTINHLFQVCKPCRIIQFQEPVSKEQQLIRNMHV